MIEKIEEGNEFVTCIEAAHVVTKNGTPGIALNVQVVSGSKVGCTKEETAFLSPKALPMSLEKLEALGFEGNDLSDLRSLTRGRIAKANFVRDDKGYIVIKNLWKTGFSLRKDNPMPPAEVIALKAFAPSVVEARKKNTEFRDARKAATGGLGGSPRQPAFATGGDGYDAAEDAPF